MKPTDFRKFLFFKMPIAWLAGLRLFSYSKNEAVISVKLSRWSQNPFKSMFWAVQGMAAELSTGVLCISKIQQSGKKISMLVIEQNGKFTKKAVGKITFTCSQGEEIDEVLQKAIETGQGITLKLKSYGIDEKGDKVAEFWFLWSFKLKG